MPEDLKKNKGWLKPAINSKLGINVNLRRKSSDKLGKAAANLLLPPGVGKDGKKQKVYFENLDNEK